MDRSGGYAEFAFIAEYYDYVVPHQERQDIAFFVEMARNSKGPVLECGCGTGRVLIPTARAGVDIVGLDFSPSMLSACKDKLLREPRDVQSRARLVHGDMRRFDLDQKFRLATAPFRSFQHMTTVGDQLSCLESIHHHLVDGGRLILDLFNPSLSHLTDERCLDEYGKEPESTMPDGRKVVRLHRDLSRDLHNQTVEGELIYCVTHPDGRKERLVHRFKLRYFFRFEVEHLLARSGFHTEEVYADYDRSPYGSTYPGELIVVALKA